MTPIPATVLTVDKQSSQYRVLVQIELERYLGSFHTLRFGARKPFTGTCYHEQLDLFYYTPIPQQAKMAHWMLNGSGFAGGCLRSWFKNLLVQVGRFSQSGRDAVP